jgi:hypothetical protein
MTDIPQEYREKAEKIFGVCHCHVDFTGRGRKDPSCMWCEFSEDVAEALFEQGREIEKLRRDMLIYQDCIVQIGVALDYRKKGSGAA